MHKLVRRILLVYPESYLSSGGGIATYLHNAIHAHLKHGREVHLLTWVTPGDPIYFTGLKEEVCAPLSPENITLVRLGDEIHAINPVGGRNKNISDLIFPHIVRAEEAFQPDLIEGTDYLFPLHSYLERRRAGLHKSSVPVATFNHGLLNDIYPATALFPTEMAQRELACEMQVVRWSDLVLAPSAGSAKRITEMRRSPVGVHILREPFFAREWITQTAFDHSRFLYFGRVSFAKGVDLFAGMLTAVNGHWPITDISFLGRKVDMPFRRSEACEFINSRLHPSLREKVRFLDEVPRDEVNRIIADAGFFGNFSRSETFSYTTLEALERGVVPLLLRDSPMAELLPPSIRPFGTFEEVPHRAAEIADVLEFWAKDYVGRIAETQQFAAELTRPDRFAEGYDQILPGEATSSALLSHRVMRVRT